ncbi:MAG: peptidoglycan DD-metalloendopeptidase family protein [Bacteroidales bacterium]|nr:peptidoglycan DD-metalloendopeptidase family protein [Bacteroidales bacterium]
MSKHIFHLVLFCLIALVPVAVQGQSNKKNSASKSQKKVVQINDLDVIYEEDEEYVDVQIEAPVTISDDESYMYDRTPLSPLTPPPPMQDVDVEDDDPDVVPQLMQAHEDEGAESENEILYASFDSETIHYPKLDVSTMTEPVNIILTHPERGENYSVPISASARASSHYGPRRRRYHYGLDLAAPKGEPIYAMFDGTVRISVRNKSYGNLVVIRHNNGLETYYAHMSARHVQPGDQVRAGDCIGLCGNTGRSYGSHLHLEIRYMGNALNPETVIDANSRKLLANSLTLTQNSFRKISARSRSRAGASATYTKGGKQFYRVRSGDTLGKIAKRNGTTINKLCKLNHISRNTTLQIGQQLRIR